jgi:hypothetical protein
LVPGARSRPNARRLNCQVRVRTRSGRRDHGISRVTAYRYLDEVIVVLADAFVVSAFPVRSGLEDGN